MRQNMRPNKRGAYYDKVTVDVRYVGPDAYQILATGHLGKKTQHLGGSDVSGSGAKKRAVQLAKGFAKDAIGERLADEAVVREI